jgi:succinate dehydrogenase / fumarate reductase iron-sulfur subunit
MNRKSENIENQIPIRLKIFRYDAKTDKPPRYEEFKVRKISEQTGMTILEALLQIQDEQDGTLAFRYSCRGAVCGSCAMLINGKFELACRVQLQKVLSSSGQTGQFGSETLGLSSQRRIETIVLEPLPNLDIIKDLVVDMEPFWDTLQQIQPWLHEITPTPEKERLMSPKEREKIDQYVNCIWCAACYGSCPVLARDEKYLGPAALAKLYRFVADPRDSRGDETLKIVNTESGAWGCDTILRCIDACPKNVRPTDGIEALRRNLIMRKFRRLFHF